MPYKTKDKNFDDFILNSFLHELKPHIPPEIKSDITQSNFPAINLKTKQEDLDKLFIQFNEPYSHLVKFLPSITAENTCKREVCAIKELITFKAILNYLKTINNILSNIGMKLNLLSDSIKEIKKKQSNLNEEIKEINEKKKSFTTCKENIQGRLNLHNKLIKDTIQSHITTITQKYITENKRLEEKKELEQKKLDLLNPIFEKYSQLLKALKENKLNSYNVLLNPEKKVYDLTSFDLIHIILSNELNHEFRLTFEQLKMQGQRGIKFGYTVQCSDLFQFSSKKRLSIQEYFSKESFFTYLLFLIIHTITHSDQNKIKKISLITLDGKDTEQIKSISRFLSMQIFNRIKTLDKKTVIHALTQLMDVQPLVLCLIVNYGLPETLTMLLEDRNLSLETLKETYETIRRLIIILDPMLDFKKKIKNTNNFITLLTLEKSFHIQLTLIVMSSLFISLNPGNYWSSLNNNIKHEILVTLTLFLPPLIVYNSYLRYVGKNPEAYMKKETAITKEIAKKLCELNPLFKKDLAYKGLITGCYHFDPTVPVEETINTVSSKIKELKEKIERLDQSNIKTTGSGLFFANKKATTKETQPFTSNCLT